jgi:hypothetical protein
MSARTKLNTIVFGGVLLFAALLGGVTHSLLIFGLVTIIGTMLMIHVGEVRLKTNDREIVQRSIGRKWKSR